MKSCHKASEHSLGAFVSSSPLPCLMPRGRIEASPLSAYELERAGNIANNDAALLAAGIHPSQFAGKKTTVEKRQYTKTADKVLPRAPSTRETGAPVRYADEFAPILGDDDDDIMQHIDMDLSDPNGLIESGIGACFCGGTEDDHTRE